MNKYKYFSNDDLINQLFIYSANAPREDRPLLREAARRLSDSINEELEHCAAVLPEDKEIRVCVGKGAAWIECDGVDIDFPDCSLAEQINWIRAKLVMNNK